MNIVFDGRTAIVTGAGSGLGRSHAHLLAKRGANVIVNDPAKAPEGSLIRAADRVVEEIVAFGGKAVANYNSVMDPVEAKAIVDQAVGTFGGVDILVNNAGFLRDRSFAKMTADEFDAVLRVHLAGAAYCTLAAWEHMRAKNYGRVVFTTSNSGLFGNFGQANYAAAKAGLIGLMNALKQEGAKYGVLVNTIAPMAATPMTENVLDAATKAAFDPAKISALVAYLSSEECAETGQIVSAAGGYVAATRIFSGRGVVLEGADASSPEAIARNWSAITDFSQVRGFADAGDEMRHIGERLKAIAEAVG